MRTERGLCLCNVVVALSVLALVHAEGAGVQMEGWVKSCSIKSGGINFSHAADVAGGIVVDPVKKYGWARKMGDATGVLVVHPISKKKPAVIKFTPDFPARPSQKVKIVIRASDRKLGVSLRVIGNKKIVQERTVNDKWLTIEIPFDTMPPFTRQMIFEISAIGWMYEYTYIDLIEIID